MPPSGAALAPGDNLQRVHAIQRAAFVREPYPTLEVRRERLARLLALTTEHEDDLVDAIDKDYCGRSSQETRLGELLVSSKAIRTAIRKLRRWMKARRVRTPLALVPGRGEILPQPLGTVGIIAPWNYPLQLAIVPTVGALAAGNRVLLKPSELTPHTSALLAELVASVFDEDELAVVTGGADVGRAFSRMRFDHLFFTGSTAVGREIARCAAEQLVPVTLELGGKSPALLAPDAEMDLAIPRLVTGKLFNAGQTCVAPDYALVPSARHDAFIARIQQSMAQLYPTLANNPDYTAIISDRHYERLEALVRDAHARGASVLTVNPRGETLDPTRRKFPPTIVTGVTAEMALMQEEIFGPVLPVETYETLDEAIAKLASRPRPLAFYYFGLDAAQRDRVLRETSAGGVTVNDTLWHFANENLPFGGVGESGSGAYHGERSFLTFSNQKSVFYQPRHAPASLLRPPYGRTFERVLTLLKRL